MLQYLINTTAIWLISLVMFDLFLRRESYHSYNRFYLLFTFLLGALLPLWQWQNVPRLQYDALQQPIEKVISVKKTIVSVSAPHTHFDPLFWLTVVYFIGASVAACLLVAEVVKLVRYFRNGVARKEGKWTIIETGRSHAPFSFVNTLFVSGTQQYAADEWQMILTHERRHTSLWHLADLVLLQAARIIFWFHPLVYIFSNRLLLVHEYQADNAQARQLQKYGKFLLEQALLPLSPSITHSFNRSPIKKRILMLSRRSSFLASTKMLVFVPVALVCVLCFSKNSLAQRFVRNGNTVTYRGNTFEFSKASADTLILVDPVTAEEVTKVVKIDPMPVKVNGIPVPKDVDQTPLYTGSEHDLRDYLVRNMKDILSKLNDGQYRFHISDILIDESGRVIYFDYENIQRSKTMGEAHTPVKSAVQITNASDPRVTVTVNGNDGKPMVLNRNTNPDFFEPVDDKLQQEVFNKVCDLMETAPAFTPAILDGKKVVGKYESFRFYNHFKVEGHKVYDMKSNGEWEEL